MADIFISYSRNDSAKALALAEQLRANGLDVWIDQHGIEGATSWSKEIANALQSCHTMLLLLSPTAVASENVTKELSVATQLKKRIVPVQVIRTTLEGEFLYHLSPLQRVKIEDFDAIVRAISGAARPSPTIRPQQPIDDRKSLMILPFEDLSPTADNAWFADGIVNELISSLSHVKAIRVTDQQTTKEYKTYKGHLISYAKEMKIRYFLQGDVRKFGDQIKISCSLLDIESGDHLWQDSYKGTMADIFDMQENVAKYVVEGLKVHLLAGESAKLSERGTDNAEAYEMYLKAEEYFYRDTKVDIEYALKAIERSLELDPEFSRAMLRRAIIMIGYYRLNGKRPELLDEAEQLIERAKQKISPAEDWRIIGSQAILTWARGDLEKALELFRENIRVDPGDVERHSSLAHFLTVIGRYDEAIPEHEAVMALRPDSYRWARISIGLAWLVKRNDLKTEYARKYIHLFEKRIRTVPDDDDAEVVYGLLLVYLGKIEEAWQYFDAIPDEHIRQEYSFRNAACLAAMCGQPERAMELLQRPAAAGFKPEFVEWLDDTELDPLRHREDFITLKQEWEEKANING